jgi:Bacterial regulatory proteins, luxR family
MLEGKPEQGHALLDAAIARVGAADDATPAARLDDPYLVCAALLLSDRSGDGLPLCARAMGIARETRQDRVIPMLAQLRCMMLENLLRLDGSLEYAEMGTEIALRLEPNAATATTLCNAAVRWVEEDPERCIREMVAGAGPMLERADRSWSTWLMSQLVRAAVALGRLEEAEASTAHLEERARVTRSPANEARAAVARSSLLVAQDRAAEGAALALAELVAGGRSNTQVAAALFLSQKTIEHHLSRIYSKPGVRSRTELAARMER